MAEAAALSGFAAGDVGRAESNRATLISISISGIIVHFRHDDVKDRLALKHLVSAGDQTEGRLWKSELVQT